MEKNFTSIKINLTEDEARGLAVLAQQELRHAHDQARFILRYELEKKGLLSKKDLHQLEKQRQSGRV